MKLSDEDKQKVIDVLSNVKKTGKRGWYSANCPYCGKESHLGVIFDEKASFNCFRCNEHGSIWKLLKFLNKLHLIKREKLIDIFKPLGWDTLIIWESELKNIKNVKNKIIEFMIQK